MLRTAEAGGAPRSFSPPGSRRIGRRRTSIVFPRGTRWSGNWLRSTCV